MHATEAVSDRLALRKAGTLGSKDGGPAAGAGGIGGGEATSLAPWAEASLLRTPILSAGMACSWITTASRGQ
eukprot:4524492-Alexandrium_andersonii.AAC.1